MFKNGIRNFFHLRIFKILLFFLKVLLKLEWIKIKIFSRYAINHVWLIRMTDTTDDVICQCWDWKAKDVLQSNWLTIVWGPIHGFLDPTFSYPF